MPMAYHNRETRRSSSDARRIVKSITVPPPLQCAHSTRGRSPQRGVFNLNIFDRTLHEPANCHVDITTDGRPDTALASALQIRDSGDALKHRIWHRFTVCDLRSPRRLVQEHFHRLLGNDRTRTNDRHALTDAFDLGEYVAGQEQSCAVPGALLIYIEAHLLVERVQAGGRLIQYQQVRIVHEGNDERKFLLVAFGELLHFPTRIELKALAEFLGGRAGTSTQARYIVNHPPAGLPVEERHITGDIPDAPAELSAINADLFTKQICLA